MAKKTQRVFLVYESDGWGHSFLKYIATTADGAFAWCEGHGSVDRTEAEDRYGAFLLAYSDEKPVSFSRHFRIEERPTDADLEPAG